VRGRVRCRRRCLSLSLSLSLHLYLALDLPPAPASTFSPGSGRSPGARACVMERETGGVSVRVREGCMCCAAGRPCLSLKQHALLVQERHGRLVAAHGWWAGWVWGLGSGVGGWKLSRAAPFMLRETVSERRRWPRMGRVRECGERDAALFFLLLNLLSLRFCLHTPWAAPAPPPGSWPGSGGPPSPGPPGRTRTHSH